MKDKDELLLNKYVDNECGFFARRKAEKLIETSVEAKTYVASIGRLSENMQSVLAPERPHSDLWPRVSMRISQEENAAVFLGERKFDEKRSIFSLPSLGFAMGSLVTALFLFSVWIPTSQQPGSLVPNASNQGALTLASAGSPVQPNPGRPQILNNEPFQSGIDVDWMRSTGRVRILQNPDERSAIIWIRKKNFQNVQRKDASSSSSEHSVQLPEDMFPRGE